MKKYLLGLFAVALAVGFSAFTHSNKQPKTRIIDGKVYADYWYVYSGPDQTVAERKKKINYTTPSTDEPNCPGGSNECAVLVTGITGTAPSNISTLTVNFNNTTGYPESGSNFLANDLKQ